MTQDFLIKFKAEHIKQAELLVAAQYNREALATASINTRESASTKLGLLMRDKLNASSPDRRLFIAIIPYSFQCKSQKSR